MQTLLAFNSLQAPSWNTHWFSLLFFFLSQDHNTEVVSKGEPHTSLYPPYEDLDHHGRDPSIRPWLRIDVHAQLLRGGAGILCIKTRRSGPRSRRVSPPTGGAMPPEMLQRLPLKSAFTLC